MFQMQFSLIKQNRTDEIRSETACYWWHDDWCSFWHGNSGWVLCILPYTACMPYKMIESSKVASFFFSFIKYVLDKATTALTRHFSLILTYNVSNNNLWNCFFLWRLLLPLSLSRALSPLSRVFISFCHTSSTHCCHLIRLNQIIKMTSFLSLSLFLFFFSKLSLTIQFAHNTLFFMLGSSIVLYNVRTLRFTVKTSLISC